MSATDPVVVHCDAIGCDDMLRMGLYFYDWSESGYPVSVVGAFRYGRNPLKWRIRDAWKVLTGRTVDLAEVVLDEKSVRTVGEALLLHVRRDDSPPMWNGNSA